jgi:tetratricopeptide (TPR) repeat protein
VARTNLLSCLEKRDLLNQSAVSINKLLEWGAVYEEAGQINDAIDFYERANAAEPLENLLGIACGEGDAFVYGRILKALNREATPQEWISLGEKATEYEKHAFAREAYKRAGLETVGVEKSEEGVS